MIRSPLANYAKRASNVRRGQVWTMDFIIGLLLFIIVMITAVRLIMILSEPTQFDEVSKDAIHVSDLLLSEGFPKDWTNETVIIPGILTTGTLSTIDMTKLEQYTKTPYERTKALYHVTHEYLYFFENNAGPITFTIDGTPTCAFGYNASTFNCTSKTISESYDNLVRIDRVVVLNNSVALLTIYSWGSS